MLDPASAGRRSSDADFAAVEEWRKNVDEKLEAIHAQTMQTNGRVSELEIKERIRQDREEQKAIRLAAAEAAKYRVEQQVDESNRTWLTRFQLWLMGAGIVCGLVASLAAAMIAARII